MPDTDQTPPEPDDQAPTVEWWTLAKAADQVGKSDRTIRRALKAGLITGQRDSDRPTAPWYVKSTDVLAHFAPTPRPAAAAVEPIREMVPLDTFREVSAQLAEAMHRVGTAEAKAGHLEERLAQARKAEERLQVIEDELLTRRQRRRLATRLRDT